MGVLEIFSTGSYAIIGTTCVESEKCNEKYHEKKKKKILSHPKKLPLSSFNLQKYLFSLAMGPVSWLSLPTVKRRISTHRSWLPSQDLMRKSVTQLSTLQEITLRQVQRCAEFWCRQRWHPTNDASKWKPGTSWRHAQKYSGVPNTGHSVNRTIWLIDFKVAGKESVNRINGPFNNRTTYDPSNTGWVLFSDLHYS